MDAIRWMNATCCFNYGSDSTAHNGRFLTLHEISRAIIFLLFFSYICFVLFRFFFHLVFVIDEQNIKWRIHYYYMNMYFNFNYIFFILSDKKSNPVFDEWNKFFRQYCFLAWNGMVFVLFSNIKNGNNLKKHILKWNIISN